MIAPARLTLRAGGCLDRNRAPVAGPERASATQVRSHDMRIAVASIALAALAALPAGATDWPEWRGPNRDGASAETGLPSRWSPAGEGLAWKAPFGSRSTPVVFGNRLYLWNPSVDTVKEREKVQERLLCLDADTGRVIWEKRFNVFHTDVPAHRVGWASPSVDPATGNIYAFGVDGHVHALDATGKVLWQRQLTEEFGEISTHGGRTVSPVIEGDLVIVSTLNSGWGDQSRGSNRYFAFDKATGAAVWISSPQSKHYDTNYSTPAVLTVDGRRLLVVGGSDGTFHGHRGHDRPADLAPRAEQARDPDERGVPRHDRLPRPQRGEPRHERDGDGRRPRRGPERHAHAGQDALAHVRLPGRLRLAGHRRRAALPGGQRRRARGLRPRERQEALGEGARDDPEGLAGDGGRQALRGHGERPSSSSSSRPPPGPRSSTRTCSAPRRRRRRSSLRRRSRAGASTSRRWTRSTRSGRRARRRRVAAAKAKPADLGPAGEPDRRPAPAVRGARQAGRSRALPGCGCSTTRAASCARSRARPSRSRA